MENTHSDFSTEPNSGNIATEPNSGNIATEPNTGSFDFKEHFVKALLGALYYLFIFIPFILPFKIWGNAATRISALWDSKTIDYQEKGKGYPLFTFYLNYLINFIFDALMFLAWPVGLIAAIVLGIAFGGIAEFGSALVGFYSLVLGIRLAKEILFFILNTLITWILDVIKNIGQLIKNIWLLNFVTKKKGN